MKPSSKPSARQGHVKHALQLFKRRVPAATNVNRLPGRFSVSQAGPSDPPMPAESAAPAAPALEPSSTVHPSAETGQAIQAPANDGPRPTSRAASFQEVTESPTVPLGLPLAPLMDVNLQVSVVLGETTMTLGDLLRLGEGSVIELDTSTGEPIGVYVNNRLYAKGEIVVVDDAFGIRLTDIVDPQRKG